MPLLPLIGLADDLTGAAEIAALAHNAGLRAVIHTTVPAGLKEVDVLILDTNTRLLPPVKAARRVRLFVDQIAGIPHAGLFKKIDSVVRGPVLAELKACAEALDRRRILIVPSNPSSGRIIKDGCYFISNQPLHTTVFARDPHHPRLTSDVIGLLGAKKEPAVRCIPPTNPLPSAGIFVGEADSPADVVFWAGQVDTHTLPAGGADFFRVWLHSRRAYQPPLQGYQLPEGGTLHINGTVSAPKPVSPFTADTIGVNPSRLPSVESLVNRSLVILQERGVVAVTTRGPVVHDKHASFALTKIFALLASQLRAKDAFRHLLVAGGATASAVLQELEWTQFSVVNVWGPGAVTLQPTVAPTFAVTMKPGSYQWPANLSYQFTSDFQSRRRKSGIPK